MDILETGNAHGGDKENPPNLPIEARTTVLEHPRTKPSRRKPSATRRSRRERKKRMRPQKLIGKGLLGHLRTYQPRTPSLRTVEILTSLHLTNGSNFDDWQRRTLTLLSGAAIYMAY